MSPDARTNTNQTVNVVISDNSTKSREIAPSTTQPAESTEPTCTAELPVNPYANISDTGAVNYVQTRDVKLEEPTLSLNNTDLKQTLDFTKLVLESYMNNPLKYNGYIIVTVPLLEHMIEILTGCDECEVVTSDPEMQCCGHELSTPFVAVVKIWVTVNGTKTIFKYTFSQYLQLFEQYNISLKLVNVQ